MAWTIHRCDGTRKRVPMDNGDARQSPLSKQQAGVPGDQGMARFEAG